MLQFIFALKFRNEPMFYFGLSCFVVALLCLCASVISNIQVSGTNAWYKPFKFSLSIGVFCWTMGWLAYELHLPGQTAWFTWVSILLLSFEIFYIVLQAARGQLSHFNLSTPLYTALFQGMGAAAATVTLWTGYIGILFCVRNFPQLPDYYLWAIRLGIFLFVVFAFEGAVMGGRLSHTIGGPDTGGGIPILNWSRRFGDPRIAHFVGMHALQLLPLLAFYFIKDYRLVIALGIAYGMMALLILIQALNGQPLFR